MRCRREEEISGNIEDIKKIYGSGGVPLHNEGTSRERHIFLGIATLRCPFNSTCGWNHCQYHKLWN